jgi:hypothetical protein
VIVDRALSFEARGRPCERAAAWLVGPAGQIGYDRCQPAA